MTQTSNPAALTRRRFLQLGGAAGAAAFVAASSTSALAATRRPAAASSNANPAQAAAFTPATDGGFRLANWLGYMDIADDGSFQTLDRFTEQTGVQVEYAEVVNDNQEFFAADLQGPLSAGQPTGWDIAVLTDWMVQRLIALDWLETIAVTPAYPANLEDVYRTRAWDPGNAKAAPWMSGMTGIGYDQKQTGEVTSLSAVFGDAFAGRMTLLSEMNDCVGLAAVFQGVDPSTLTQEQFDAAIALIKGQVDSGVVRRVTGNDYIQDLTSGDVIMAMAWSGDIANSLAPLNGPDHDFVWRLPDEGGMIWTDNMVIPKGAEYKQQAETWIDWYYNPANSAELTAFVKFVSPVKGGAEALVAVDPDAAQDPLIFPTAEMRARLHEFVSQAPDVRAAWEETFAETIGL